MKKSEFLSENFQILVVKFSIYLNYRHVFVMLVQRWFHMFRLCYHCMFLIPSSFGIPGRLCFLILGFPRYFQLYFDTIDLLFPKIGTA